MRSLFFNVCISHESRYESNSVGDGKIMKFTKRERGRNGNLMSAALKRKPWPVFAAR